MTKTRMAAIDIDTNSMRCIVTEANKAGRFKILDDEKVAVRLGEKLAETGLIPADAAELALETAGRFRKLLTGLKVKTVEAVASGAVGNSANGAELVSALTEELGYDVRVISGEEEAELAAVSALCNFDMSGKRFAIADIGGGSLEVVTAFGHHIEEFYTFDLGAMIMTERFLGRDPIDSAELQKLQRHTRECLKKSFSDEKVNVDTLIASGGTVTSLGSMVMNLRRDSNASVHGYEVLRSEIVHLLAMLSHRDLKARCSIPGLAPDRADIIVAGITIIDELMRFLGANRLLVNERGIREGLIIRTMKRNGLMPAASPPQDWRESVLEFARSCQVDEPHALHVASLALSIFDSLAPHFELNNDDRRILEAAAILHDTGSFISYVSHHKHSYHLIRHAELFAFSPAERELVAQVARYHRKTLPRQKHVPFQALRERDRLLVERLAGILRLSDGLDRRRAGSVQGITCEFCDMALTIEAECSGDITVEIFGGNSKKDLFEKAFSAEVVFATSRS